MPNTKPARAQATDPGDRLLYTHDQGPIQLWRLVARVCEHSHEEYVQRQRWVRVLASWKDVPGLASTELQEALLASQRRTS